MKIGILSDTHGNIKSTEKAARCFREAGVCAVFHCGDIGGMDVLTELATICHPGGCQVHAVLGNVDVYSDDWKFYPSNIGVILHGRFGDIALEHYRIALIHGDDTRRYARAVFCGAYDLVLSGHSHEVHDHTSRKTRCINPGTAGRGSPLTCMVLDLTNGAAELVEL